jgi:hypothetical protein
MEVEDISKREFNVKKSVSNTIDIHLSSAHLKAARKIAQFLKRMS